MKKKRLIRLSLTVLFVVLVVAVYASCQRMKPDSEKHSESENQGGEAKPDARQKTSEIKIRPGQPIWVTATIENPARDSMQTIRPDCFNTVFSLKSEGGWIHSSCRLRAPYTIPDDLVTIQGRQNGEKHGGQFKVRCNLGGVIAPAFSSLTLISGKTYSVAATYHNSIEDPDLQDGRCLAEDNECYRLWTGKIQTGLSFTTVKVEGEPVVPISAKVDFKPDKWSTKWTKDHNQRVMAMITGLDSKLVDRKKILLNGQVGPIEDGVVADGISSDTLNVPFDGWEALNSVGTPVPGVFYVTVQGDIEGSYFAATGRVVIEGQRAGE